MGNKYKGKYRGTTARLQIRDYGWAASYFITVNTKQRICYFGRISNGKMQLTEAGCIALQYWNEIPGHFQYVKLGAFVIMPDHIHGIISIQKKLPPTKDSRIETNTNNGDKALSPGQKRFRNQGKGTLSAIVGSYKSVVTKNIRPLIKDFAWQPRFHYRIIRDPEAYMIISKYIENNPKKWKGCTHHGKCKACLTPHKPYPMPIAIYAH